MPKFKVLWSGTIFATSYIEAKNKEEAITRTEGGELDFDHINDLDDVEIEECSQLPTAKACGLAGSVPPAIGVLTIACPSRMFPPK